MRKAWVLGAAFAISSLAALGACGDDEAEPPALDASADAPATTPPHADAGDAGAPLARGARVLGVGLDLGDRSFYDDLRFARDAGGVQATSLSFAWDEVERPVDAGADAGADAGSSDAGADAGDAGAPETLLFNAGLHVANLLLSNEHASATLALDALDVGGSRAPADLASRPLDDPELAARYARLLDYALPQMYEIELPALFVASGADVALGDDPARYAAFATFVARAAAHAKAVRPGLPVGFTVTAAGLVAHGDLLAAAWAASDVVGVEYVPLDAAGRARGPDEVLADVARIVDAAPSDTPVVFSVFGYPSSPGAGSDEVAQAAFVASAFRAWDAHAERVPFITWLALDDAAPEVVAAEAARLGRSDAPLLAALGSLGLRARDGRAKPSLAAFVREARARGW